MGQSPPELPPKTVLQTAGGQLPGSSQPQPPNSQEGERGLRAGGTRGPTPAAQGALPAGPRLCPGGGCPARRGSPRRGQRRVWEPRSPRRCSSNFPPQSHGAGGEVQLFPGQGAGPRGAGGDKCFPKAKGCS